MRLLWLLLVDEIGKIKIDYFAGLTRMSVTFQE